MTGLMTLRSEWEEQGRPGDFNLYENARMTEMFDEMGGRIRSLDGAERAETEQALVDSFNLYFSKQKKALHFHFYRENRFSFLLVSGFAPIGSLGNEARPYAPAGPV